MTLKLARTIANEDGTHSTLTYGPEGKSAPMPTDGKGPDTRTAEAQLSLIKDFRDQEPALTNEWIAAITTILDYQLEDGSFPTIVDPTMPFDCRVFYLYRPSYACCQALTKAHAYLDCWVSDNKIQAVSDSRTAPADLIARIDDALTRGLSFCCTRKLVGDGVMGLQHQTEDLQDFLNAHILYLRARHHDLCPEFFDLIEDIAESYSRRLSEADFIDGWGTSFAEPFARIADAFDLPCSIPVFVYGTLMAGCRNASLVTEQPYLGSAELQGYALFDLGSYPGIRKSEDIEHRGASVMGELRLVDPETLSRLNELEGEGTLYKATRVTVETPAGPRPALTYVYLHGVDPADEIPVILQPYNRYLSQRRDLVWYVAYGSNIKYERLMNYIQGGTCRYNGRTYHACPNSAAPLACQPCSLPYSVYFGNESPTWHGFGVAFLDITKPGFALGRAYLITRKQLEHIHNSEGRGANWYPTTVDLDPIAGIPAVTFTNPELRPGNIASCDYEDVLTSGLEETYPWMSDDEVDGYLCSIRDRSDELDDDAEDFD